MNVLSAALPEFLGSLGATLIVALAGWMKRRWRRQARTEDTTLSPATGETGRAGAMDRPGPAADQRRPADPTSRTEHPRRRGVDTC